LAEIEKMAMRLKARGMDVVCQIVWQIVETFVYKDRKL